MSYTDVFSGNTIQPANKSYVSITLSENTTLSWPTQFVDTNNVVAGWMDINASVVGKTLTLPDARLASNGQQIVIVNTGNQTFNLLKNDGDTLLQNIAAGSAKCICLYDNDTAAGSWRFVPFGQGSAAVTSVAATAPTRGFTITGSPITNNGTLQFQLSDMLAELETTSATGSAGLMTQTGDSQLELRSITSGNTNIAITNPDGNGGDIDVTLSTTLGNLTSIDSGNIRISGNTISSTNTDGSILLSPNGVGVVEANKDFEMLNGKKLYFANTADTRYVSLSNPNGTNDLDFNLPTSLPVNDNSIIACSTTGQLNPSALTTTIATKQQMQDASSAINPVTPSNFRYSHGSAKAFGVFDGTSVQTGNNITSICSYNISSIYKYSTGVYTITTVQFFTNRNLILTGSACNFLGGVDPTNIYNIYFQPLDESRFYIYVKNSTGNFVDVTNVSFVAHGILST